jgi:hypothetical protein
MSRIEDIRAEARRREIADSDMALRLPRLRQRFDSGLGLVLLSTVLAGATSAFMLASWLDVSGYLDPPLVAEVKDPRILVDYRDNPAPIVDLVALGPDLLIGRKDGSIDRYASNDRLFSAETLPRGPSFSGDLALLSVDCEKGDCGEGQQGTAFALTAKGGLARRDRGQWQVVLGDMAFVGADGVPVEQDDLRGWAVSDDGARVLLDAGEKGLGLFDQKNGSWQSGPSIPGVTQGPLFAQGAFWLGSAAGLHRITLSGNRVDWGAQVMPETEGEILDLAPDPEGAGMLVLRRGNCEAGGAGCLSLLSVSRAGTIDALMQEIEAMPDLNDAGLKHVAMQGNDLLVLGTAGVHRYEAAARRWRLIEPQEPTAWFAKEGGDPFHIALPDRVLTFSTGRQDADIALEVPLVQILPGAGRDLFGLDRQGRILSLAAPSATVIASADPGTPTDARFTVAVALERLFVALGPQGVLVHDTLSRRYSFVPAQGLPPLPIENSITFAGTEGRIWMVARANGGVWSLTVSGDFPDKEILVAAHGEAGFPVSQARPQGNSIELIGRDGQVVRLLSDGGFAPLVGDPLAGRLNPVSVTSGGPGYFFTNGSAVWNYRSDMRGWLGPVPSPQGRRLTDLAFSTGGLLGLDAAGMVHSLGDEGWSPVSGGPLTAAFGSADLQDAMAAGETLYLASDGQVQSYLPGERRFDTVWSTSGRNAEILSISNRLPLWTSSAGLWRGNDQIFGGQHFQDGWLSRNGPVALGQVPGGPLYLAGPGGCLYLGDPAPRGEIRDVVQLDAERLLVRAAGGAGIYQAELHRWLDVTLPGMGAGSRLLRMGGHLVRLDPDGFASIPIVDIPVIDSCETTTVRVDWPVNEQGLQASVVDGEPEILLLARNGALRRWRDGQFITDMVAPGTGPRMDRLIRAWPHDGGILAGTADALWRYDLVERSWRHWPFAGGPSDVAELDLSRDGEGLSMTIWDRNGAAWGGFADLSQREIELVSLRRFALPQIATAPDQIRDIADISDRIAVLSERQLAIFPQGRGAADLEIALPAARQGWQLGTDQSGAIILTDGDRSAPFAIYRIASDLRGRIGLDQAAAHYLPGDDYAYAVTAGPGLLRIDRELNTWQCDFRVGGDPECRLLTGPPMELSSVDVVAYDRDHRILLTETSLWRLDRASRPIAQVSDPEVNNRGQMLRNGSALLYWEGPGRALWRIDTNPTERLFPAVQAIRPINDALAVLAAGEVSGLRDGHPVTVSLPDGVAESDLIRSHFSARGMVLALASGEVRTMGSGPVSDPLLQFASDAVTVLPVPGAAGEWLEAAPDGVLRIRFVDKCERPAPGLEPLAPEFIGPPPVPVEWPAIVEPCAQERTLPLTLDPGEIVLDLAQSRDGALQILTDRRLVTLDASGTGVAEEDLSGLAETPRSMREARPDGGFREIAGRSLLNPPAMDRGQLLGGPDVRQLQLLPPLALPAWNNGWISWLRETREIRFAGTAESVALPLGDALVGGTFLPLREARALRLPGGVVAWMSGSGLWHQQGERLRLVRMQAQPLPLSIDFGQFIAAQARISAVDGGVTAAQVRRDFSAGGIGLSVDPLQGRVSVVIEIGGQPISDVAPRGFLHDQRLSVAQSGGVVRLLTPVGMVRADSLSGGMAVPLDTRNLAAEGGGILAEGDAGWMQLAGGQTGWSRAAEPFRNALLAEENGRTWQMRDGVVGITANDSWRVARQGLDFDIDQLVGFAATPEVSVAITRAGTHAVPSYSGLRSVIAPVAAAPSGLPLDARRGDGGASYLYTRAGLIWDGVNWRPAAQGERPWESRQAASLSGISLGFGPGPRISVDVRPLADPVAKPLRFEWDRGEAMPFDAVTALHADKTGGELLLGTKLGIRVLSPVDGGYMNGPILVPVRDGQPIASPVSAVGRPAASPERIEAAFASGDCATMPGLTTDPQVCASPADLSSRFVAADDFWRITKSADSIRWAYLIDGQERPLSLPMGGHMPHDLLSDRMTCAGVLTERWHDQSILRIGRQQFDLSGLEGLYCLTAAAQMEGGGRLAAGLYALVPGSALHFARNGFSQLSGAERDLLATHLSGRVVMETGRLRYGLEAGSLETDYLALAGNWIETPWSGGRLVVDQPKALAWRGGLQSITDAGVVATTGGVISPATLRLMLGSDAQSLAACAVARAEMADGRSQGLDAMPDDPLRLYCKDGSWLEGVGDGQRDFGTFRPVEGAPSKRELVSVPEMWTATADYDADGAPVSVSFTFRDEPARLGTGRFDFDSLQQIAAPFGNEVELLTDSGWWRSTRADLGLEGTRRPDLALNPRSSVGFGLDLSRRSGAAGLCLTFDDGKAIFWAGGTAGLESAGACREDRGRGGLWQWWHEEEKPVATASSLNGAQMTRRLTGGRFSDLVLSGSPLLEGDGSLLVPAELGVLVLDAVGGMPHGIYAFAPEGALTRTSNGDPVWLGDAGLTLLRGQGREVNADRLACPAVAELPMVLPDGNRIMRLQPGGSGWLDARVQTGTGPAQTLVDCKDATHSRAWSHRRDVSDHSRSLSLGSAAISEMQIALQPQSVVLSDGVAEARFQAGLDVAALRGMVAPPGGTEFFTVDEHRLIRIALAPAISALAAHGRVIPSPVPSESDPVGADAMPPAAAPDLPPDAPPDVPAVPVAEPASPVVQPVPDPVAEAKQAPISAGSATEEPSYNRANVQAALGRALGRRLVADGIIGQQSRSAIADWQTRIGSEPTGFLSEEQVALLLESAQP